MAGLNLNLISLIVFYTIVVILLYMKRKNVTVQSKVLFLYKTQRFNQLMRRIAEFSPRFWRGFGVLSIPIGFSAMAFVFAFLTWKLFEMFIAPAPPLQIILPFTSTVSVGPILFVSFWYFIISIFVVVLVHEGAHGIVAEAFKQKIKSAGAGMFLLIPLAFVEPDEEKLKKAPAKTQLAIFSAGAMANFVTALLILLVSVFLVAPVVFATVDAKGIEVYALTQGYPAEAAGLGVGDKILSVNGLEVKSPRDFSEIMAGLRPGDSVSIQTETQAYDITTIADPRDEERTIIGVSVRAIDLEVKPSIREKYGTILPTILLYLYNPIANTLPEQGLLQWIFALNLGIGIINLLPLGAIDGGRMADLGLQRVIKNPGKAKKAFSILTVASILLIVFNLIGPYIVRNLA
jgi:membrane-associated protease RseP (regulator of RpoE activity)